MRAVDRVREGVEKGGGEAVGEDELGSLKMPNEKLRPNSFFTMGISNVRAP